MNAMPTTAEIIARKVRLGAWVEPAPVVIPFTPAAPPPPPTRESVKRAIMTLTELEAPATWLLLARICRATGVSLTELRGDTRQSHIALARQFAAWMLVRKRKLDHEQVAQHLNRDRTTIIHAVNVIDKIMGDAQ